MPLQTKVEFRLDGKKVKGISPSFTPTSQRPGGVAQGGDGPIDQYSGEGETHSISGVKIWVDKAGLAFKPWLHTRAGTEFDVDFTQGDPAFGGSTVTYQRCLCTGEAMEIDNEQGRVLISIPEIRATRRIG